jgi:transcriptional regulator with XRE-family HTH domain
VTGRIIRTKRMAAGIAGYAVRQRAGTTRSRLSEIEREYVIASPEELRHIDEAIDEILRTKERLAKFANEAGLSLTGVRF